MMLRKTTVTLVLSLAWGLSPVLALAQDAEAPANPADQLKELTVTSTRTERRVDNVPNTVTVIPQQRIEQQGARDIKYLLDGEVEPWGGRVQLTYSASKSSSRIAPARMNMPQFAPSAYTVVDLGMYWKPKAQFTVNANLNNLFNAKYWRWSDVRGLDDNSTVKDAYTAPGRQIQISVRYDF